MSLNLGIIGLGAIGEKRALAANAIGFNLVACFDKEHARVKNFSEKFGMIPCQSEDELFHKNDVDAVIVSTSNDVLFRLGIKALNSGKHVLLEKPGARLAAEMKDLVQLSEKVERRLAVGFNHRFHPGLLKAKALLKENAIGELMYVRAKYGHGGRLGYEKEWRANPQVSGGGELIDQGVHLIDLVQWYEKGFILDKAILNTHFWSMDVEDNSFLILKNQKKYAFLHASCTEWKNVFDFELVGTKGKFQIGGLGRSYGTETLRWYKVKPEMGVPDEEVFQFAEGDYSWELELKAFRDLIEGGTSEIATGFDALSVLNIVTEAYERSQFYQQQK